MLHESLSYIDPTTTFADDTAVLATDSDPAFSSEKLQTNLAENQNFFKKWRINAEGSKSVHVTFTTRKKTCPTVHIEKCISPPQKKESSISGYTLTEDLPGTNIFS
jgi:hypothetical protein